MYNHYLATRTQGHDHIQACVERLVVSLFRKAGYTATTKHVPRISRAQDQYYVADLFVSRMALDSHHGGAMDISTVHDFHGSAGNPSENGILRHPDIGLALSQRAQERVDEYQEGYAAFADKKTTLSFEAMGEAVDVVSAVYCWRRGGIFWRMRASLGLACAQAATLCTQVVVRPRPRA